MEIEELTDYSQGTMMMRVMPLDDNDDSNINKQN